MPGSSPQEGDIHLLWRPVSEKVRVQVPDGHGEGEGSRPVPAEPEVWSGEDNGIRHYDQPCSFLAHRDTLLRPIRAEPGSSLPVGHPHTGPRE